MMPARSRPLATFAVLACACVGVDAATYTVTSAADGGPGTLRAALADMAARPASEDHVVNIVVPPTQTLALASALPPIRGNRVTIDASGAVDFWLTGQALLPLFVLDASGAPSELTVRGFGLASGRRAAGGCLFDPQVSGRQATITLERMEFINCTAVADGSGSGGGAVRTAVNTTLIVIDSRFINNSTRVNLASGFTEGGAISSFGPAVIVDSEFFNNVAQALAPGNTASGAAVHIRGDADIRDSHFASNEVISVDTANASYGAVICGFSGQCTIDSSSFHANPSTAVGMGSGTVVNSSFWDNGSRVAIFAAPGSGTLRILNSSFLRSGPPGNFFAFLAIQAVGTLVPDIRVSNNLFGPKSGATFACGMSPQLSTSGGGWNLSVDTSCNVFSSVNVGESEVRFGPPVRARGRAFVLSLERDSIAVDRGNPDPPGSSQDACTTVDASGRLRPQHGNPVLASRCDFGAFEVPDWQLFRDGFEP